MSGAGAAEVWRPQPGSQQLFLSCPVYEALIAGTRGNGKTDTLLMDFAQHCGVGYGQHWRGILFRQSYPQLADVVAKAKKWFYRIFPGIQFNATSYVWRWPTGEELLLRHMAKPEDYWAYHGHEYPWIGWEELTNWPTLDCYDSMKACSRSSFPGMPRKIRATTNPYGRGHNAVKKHFIDPAPFGTIIRNDQGLERVAIRGHWSENKALLAADPDYPKKLASDVNPHRRKAWLDGDWSIQAGGMFDDVWEQRVHVLREFNIPAGWRVDRAFDWGSSKPFCALWFAESNGETVKLADGTARTFPRGSVFVIDEDYGCEEGQENRGIGMSSRDIARRNLVKQKAMLERLRISQSVLPGPGDLPEPQDGSSPRKDMAAEGMLWKVPAKGTGSRVAGWQQLRTMLSAAKKDSAEDPHLYVFDRCRALIRTLPGLPRDEKKTDDIDTDAEDHPADTLRYRLIAPRHTLNETEGGI